jgi:sugar lactone lactonase YvrE
MPLFLPHNRFTFTLYAFLFTNCLALTACGGSNENPVTAPTPQLTLEFVAGELGGQGNADGAVGRFTSPQGIAVGPDGAIYVSESTDEPIRRIDSDGVVSRLANTAKNKFWVEKFYKDVPPSRSLAVDSANNLYYAVENECLIHKVAANGETSIYAGQATCGFANGHKSQALFGKISSIAIDGFGSLYLTDPENSLIRKIDTNGMVSTLAGRVKETGVSDGMKELARFTNPLGITVDNQGVLYVTDNNWKKIRKIMPDGLVTTLNPHWENTKTPVEFTDLLGAIVTDQARNIYVMSGTQILKISPNGNSRVLAGEYWSHYPVDGQGEKANFGAWARGVGEDSMAMWTPGRLSIDQQGFLYFADTIGHCIRKISPEGAVTTIAGIKPNNDWRHLDGQGSAARFFTMLFDINDLPESSLETNYSLRMDNNRNVIVTGRGWALPKQVARQVSPSGMVTSLEPWGSSNPDAVAKNINKYWFSTETSGRESRTVSGAIFMQDSKGELRTLAGDVGAYYKPKDGIGGEAKFFNITALTLDNADNIYVIDRDRVPSPTPWEMPGRLGYLQEGGLIRKITPAGVVTTIAGSLDERGHVDGPGNKARFHAPMSIAGDQYGNMFVADTLNHVIRKISPDGMVSTFAGTPEKTGFADGLGNKASFNTPNIIVFDRHGNLYVADSGNFLIRKITPAGEVTTIAGTPGSRGVITGQLPASLSFISGLTIDDQDTLYIFSEGALLKIVQKK